MEPREGAPTARPRGLATPGRRLAGCLVILVLLAGIGLASVLLLLERRPRLRESVADSIVTSVLQREARRAFLVTGSLDLAVTTRVRTSTRLLPGLLDVPLGTTESTVRVPGRVSYGVRVSDIHERDITVRGDTIDIRLPEPRIYSVEAALERMEVETESGWLTLRGEARDEVERRAIGMVRGALREQAARHLATSEQPRIHSAQTLHDLLRPVFRSAGIDDPVFRFQLSGGLSWTGEP